MQYPLNDLYISYKIPLEYPIEYLMEYSVYMISTLYLTQIKYRDQIPRITTML